MFESYLLSTNTGRKNEVDKRLKRSKKVCVCVCVCVFTYMYARYPHTNKHTRTPKYERVCKNIQEYAKSSVPRYR